MKPYPALLLIFCAVLVLVLTLILANDLMTATIGVAVAALLVKAAAFFLAPEEAEAVIVVEGEYLPRA